MNDKKLCKYIALAFCSLFWASLSMAQDANQECEVIDFNQFSHGDAIQSLSLFGGTFALNVQTFRNRPAAVVNATAYDTERWDNAGNPPPNNSHDDTQLNIGCNDAANGGLGNCDGIMAVIPDVDFEENGDDTQGGTITFTSTGGEFEILQYNAVDSDDASKRIILNVGGVNVGEATVFGDGSVITVTTDDHITTQAEFEFLGSGGIDDIEVCRLVERAALGDRVWEDLNTNGIQDCSDTGGDGVIGNDGDAGPECDAGVPDVPVNLLAGDCVTSLGKTVMTDLNGFYLFEDLDPGDYCVEFGKPPADFCDTDGFDLGEPQFTAQNAGNDDAVDSDADTATGITDPVSLAASETDLAVDAGIACPAKIGDRVWSDDNGNGIQDDGPDGVEGVKVTLFECGADMVAGTADDVDTGQMRNTGADGMYMFGAEPDFILDPGKYFVQFTKPDGTQFAVPNVNGDDINSDCLPPDGITACTTLASRGINLDRDCGLIPPPSSECDLELDKKCSVEIPPVTGDLECEAKIAATVLEYIGAGTPGVVTVAGKNRKATVAANFDPNTGILTVDARPGDLGSKMTITTDGVAEVIHTSCSAPYVAGQPAPLDNPKGDPSANWLVLSFVDKEGGSASVPDGGNGDGDGVFTDNCTLTEPSQNVTYQYVVTNNGDALTGIAVTDNMLGDIGTIPALGSGDSDTLTTTARISGTTVNTGTASALLNGEVCSASDSTTVFEPPPVAGGECDGKVTDLTLKNLGTSAQVRVEQKKGGDTVFDDFVAEGGEFSFTGTDKKGTLSTEISIFVDGILNTKIHTSCSKPIGPGLVSGSFEVISGNSRNGGPLPPI